MAVTWLTAQGNRDGAVVRALVSHQCRFDIENSFSNSLIICEEKTKEITAVREVWKCSLNYHKT